MVGDFGVGKTSLVRRIVDNSFSDEYLSTIGVSISKKNLDNATLMLWDIEGHTEFKPIFKQYLLGSKGFIIVADITRENTIESIKRHIELCHSIMPGSPICVALNKCDMKHDVSEENRQELKKLSETIVDIYFTSAKNGDSVLEIFTALNDSIATQIKKR
ncbi:GTP-binding protein [Sulfurimonas aquatica]|uniref:GTP-binding protein n=2 Tax=Sulfurimonas aquatica TaxID=2672570 RepID=A0A975B2T2_9BACT|nr:GTP-binding protein [Sulfurimonas aquatica]